MPSDPITAVAEAVQEVAKVTGKGIEAITELSHFVSEFTRAPLAAGFGIVADRLTFMRAERQLRFQVRTRELLSELGIAHPTRAVPLKFAVPLLEQASLEEDDSLQDLWAHLLVNAANASSPVEMRRAFISILEQLTSLDALILLKIYSLLPNENQREGVVTGELPQRARNSIPGETVDNWAQPSLDVKLSLENLERVGCIDIGDTFGGPKFYPMVQPTVLGRAFVDAVTLHRVAV
ncbi:Abi-alpha family protein [Massilia sp. SYSU DXS3249]